jgi:hypothetical protein
VALAVVRPVELGGVVVNAPTGVRVADAADAVPAIPTESTVVVMRAIAAYRMPIRRIPRTLPVFI